MSAFHFALFDSLTSWTADWQTWLTQEDVDGMAAANLNSIRVPLPFWIIEAIVDQTHEPYAQGGLDELVRFSGRRLNSNAKLWLS